MNTILTAYLESCRELSTRKLKSNFETLTESKRLLNIELDKLFDRIDKLPVVDHRLSSRRDDVIQEIDMINKKLNLLTGLDKNHLTRY